MTNPGLRISPSMAAVLILHALAFADTLHVPDDYPTIQACIDAAFDGDECVVAPGVYKETINFNGKGITLRSSDGPDCTTIDGTDLNDSVVKCISGEGCDTMLEGFRVTGGNASWGGGMLNDNSSPTVKNCVFTRNAATSGGGGMANRSFSSSSSPSVINCRFLMNTADQGGGMNNNGPDGAPTSDPNVVNCVFDGNTATTGGGGMVNNNGASSVVTNCTFSGNSAGTVGGGMVNSFSSPGQVLVKNCIFWNNSPDQIAGGEGGETVVCYSDVEGGWSGADGTGNINSDPLFVDADGDDNVPGTEDDDLRLSVGSPCIDAGDTWSYSGPPVDLGGNPRALNDPTTSDTGIPTQGLTIDMGAYEYGEFCFPDAVPAVSEWGLAVMALLVLTAGTIVYRRRAPARP